MATLKERLKELRITKGMTQKQMATLLNLKEARNYRHYESGNVIIPTSKLLILADHFDVSVDYILCRADNPRGLTSDDWALVQQAKEIIGLFSQMSHIVNQIQDIEQKYNPPPQTSME